MANLLKIKEYKMIGTKSFSKYSSNLGGYPWNTVIWAKSLNDAKNKAKIIAKQNNIIEYKVKLKK